MMKRSKWRQNVRTASARRTKLSKRLFTRSRVAAFETLEDRRLLADYGDAPDLGLGTGFGNYNTVAADNGPSHTSIGTFLWIGSSFDDDSGTLQNPAANADDSNGAAPDDEDGVINPAADLVLTVGAQPMVDVRVTSVVLSSTLYGWIDYNANGVFENATERTSVAVGAGTFNSIVKLVFPAVPSGFTGTTYARFRLSMDAAAANPTGPASVRRSGRLPRDDHQAQRRHSRHRRRTERSPAARTAGRRWRTAICSAVPWRHWAISTATA